MFQTMAGKFDAILEQLMPIIKNEHEQEAYDDLSNVKNNVLLLTVINIAHAPTTEIFLAG